MMILDDFLTRPLTLFRANFDSQMSNESYITLKAMVKATQKYRHVDLILKRVFNNFGKLKSKSINYQSKLGATSVK